jgi:hypothetical protein
MVYDVTGEMASIVPVPTVLVVVDEAPGEFLALLETFGHPLDRRRIRPGARVRLGARV